MSIDDDLIDDMEEHDILIDEINDLKKSVATLTAERDKLKAYVLTCADYDYCVSPGMKHRARTLLVALAQPEKPR